MCVICVKKAGIPMPTEENFENMWTNNRDGAGFMWADGNVVHISKGFMKLSDFQAAVKDLQEKRGGDLTNTSIVFHFRIGTAGGNVPANTHPFPLTDKICVMQKLNCATSLGIAHNGIIDITTRSKDISDTMEWIASQLYLLAKIKPYWYLNDDCMALIKSMTGSKLAFMTPDGEVYTVGDFIEDHGLLYSNSSYSYNWYTRSYHYTSGNGYISEYWGDYGDELDPDDWGIPVKKKPSLDKYHYTNIRLMRLPEKALIEDLENQDLLDTGTREEIYMLDRYGALYLYDQKEDVAYPFYNDVFVYDYQGKAIEFEPGEAEFFRVDEENPLDMITNMYANDYDTDQDYPLIPYSDGDPFPAT